jgi:hypothetical protein
MPMNYGMNPCEMSCSKPNKCCMPCGIPMSKPKKVLHALWNANELWTTILQLLIASKKFLCLFQTLMN